MKREKTVFAILLSLIAVFSAVALLLLTDMADAVWPGADSVAAARSALAKAQVEMKVRGAELAAKRQSRRQFMKGASNYWMAQRDGKAEDLIVRRIEEISKNSKVSIGSLGNSKTSKVNEQFSFFDFNIEAQAPMEDMARFMVDVYKASPKFHWTRCVLRPSKPNDSKEISMSASLRVVCIDDEGMAKKILEEDAK